MRLRILLNEAHDQKLFDWPDDPSTNSRLPVAAKLFLYHDYQPASLSANLSNPDFARNPRSFPIAFVEHLESLAKAVSSPMIQQALARADKWYSNPFQNKALENLETKWSDQLLAFYRLRNLLIHSAEHDPVTLSVEISSARLIARSYLTAFTYALETSQANSLVDAADFLKARYDVLRARWQDQESFDFEDFPFLK